MKVLKSMSGKKEKNNLLREIDLKNEKYSTPSSFLDEPSLNP